MNRRNNPEHASALQIVLSLALISVSAILLATAAQTDPKKTFQQVTAVRDFSGDTTRAIVSPATATAASACGAKIAFFGFSPNGIYLMNPDGSGQAMLVGGFSPSVDGTSGKIAFKSFFNPGIHIINADGSGFTQLTSDPNDDKPSISRDGSKIAFQRGPAPVKLYVMNANGSDQKLVLADPQSNSLSPACNHDCSKIAFYSGRASPGVSHIFVINADGSGVTQITSGALPDLEPAFSPDDSKITFVAFREAGTNNVHTYVTDATPGATVTQLTTGAFIDDRPSFSSDGSQIVFSHQPVNGGAHTVCLINATPGSSVTQVTSGFDTSFGGCPGAQLIGLEVTQGVQDLNNSVPLVEHKKTFVRAHVKNVAPGLTRISTSASLTAKNTTTGTVLGTITNSNPGGQISVARFPVRIAETQSFLFDVPPAWRTGTVEFSFAGNGVTFGCVNGGTACRKATVTFQPVDPLSMKFVFLTWRSGGVDHSTTLADLPQVVGEFLGRYPINLVDTFVGSERVTIDPCTLSNVERILRFLNQLRNSDCSSGPCLDFYQGLLADQNACSSTAEVDGLADSIPGHASAAFVNTGSDISARVHEQGHVMGLDHTDYNSSRNLIPPEKCLVVTPCTMLEGDGTLSLSKDQYALDTVYGYDVNDSSPRKIWPAETPDFMSYGYPTWPSRTNYELLFNKFVLPVASAASGKLKQNQMSASQTVIIDGSIQFNGPTGQLGSVFVKTTPVNVTLPDPGDFSIRLEDSQGAQLARFAFDPLRGSGEADFPTGAISLLLPWDPDAKRIVLLHNEDVLDSREASANPPSVSVSFPNGSEVLSDPSATFTWTANDADGDALTYSVEYSPDNGATWQTLAIDWNSQSLAVDLTKLHGSNQALIRVTACDGFDCAHAQSQGTFTVSDHAPLAVISSPENNQLYVGAQTIVLEGTGSDIEDGALGDASLSWTSNLNGPLGTGSSLVIDAMTLQEGTHTITLTATDSTGHVGSASIPIKVFRIFSVSRKTHGDAGDFDVELPLTGTPGIECRSGGATNDHTIIVAFPSAVTVNGSPQAQVTAGTGTVGSGGSDNGGVVDVSGNVVTIPLTNVPNGQTINVMLQGVNDGTTTNNVSVPMSVLAGDTNADGVVDAVDVAQTKSKSGQGMNATNFREDVNTDGFLDAVDVAFVKSKSATSLTASPPLVPSAKPPQHPPARGLFMHAGRY